MDEQFSRDVMHGLSAKPKYLHSKYFYDQYGDSLFQQIMELEEYYLTRCEYEIFQNHKEDLLGKIWKNGQPFDLIELGAGDGKKTRVLLEYFLTSGVDFIYKPIDISVNVLNLLAENLRESLPGLKLQPIVGEYFHALEKIETESGRSKVILFLGSNIGNFRKPAAKEFLSLLASSLVKGNMLLLGVDLVKDPKVVARAYNDCKGITRAFNLNLLSRINRELGGNFDLEKFEHFPIYNPISGTARSFLISKVNQSVTIEKLNAIFHFNAWEAIHTEYSHKYRLDELTSLAEASGFEIIKYYADSRNYFVDGLWQVNK